MVWDFSLKTKSASIIVLQIFRIVYRWKWLKSAFQKGLKNGRKSGKSQGILGRILSGNLVISTHGFL